MVVGNLGYFGRGARLSIARRQSSFDEVEIAALLFIPVVRHVVAAGVTGADFNMCEVTGVERV